MKVVSYLRVSTASQGESGLGLDAQRAAIESYTRQRAATVLRVFTEVESGGLNERPELAKAIRLAEVTGATLLIAKLDRLSRNAAFLLALRDSGIKFVAADLPDANELTVGIMALVAEQERQAISRRTKEALGAAKARGQRLGNPHGAAPLRRAGKGNSAAVAAVKRAAQAHAERLREVVHGLRLRGITSLGAVAAALNEESILTSRGGTWHKSTVRNLLSRLDL